MELDDIINKYSTNQDEIPEPDKKEEKPVSTQNSTEATPTAESAEERKRRIAEMLSKNMSRMSESGKTDSAYEDRFFEKPREKKPVIKEAPEKTEEKEPKKSFFERRAEEKALYEPPKNKRPFFNDEEIEKNEVKKEKKSFFERRSEEKNAAEKPEKKSIFSESVKVVPEVREAAPEKPTAEKPEEKRTFFDKADLEKLIAERNAANAAKEEKRDPAPEKAVISEPVKQETPVVKQVVPAVKQEVPKPVISFAQQDNAKLAEKVQENKPSLTREDLNEPLGINFAKKKPEVRTENAPEKPKTVAAAIDSGSFLKDKKKTVEMAKVDTNISMEIPRVAPKTFVLKRDAAPSSELVWGDSDRKKTEIRRAEAISHSGERREEVKEIVEKTAKPESSDEITMVIPKKESEPISVKVKERDFGDLSW